MWSKAVVKTPLEDQQKFQRLQKVFLIPNTAQKNEAFH